MKVEEYNNIDCRFMLKHFFMRHPMFRRMRRHNEGEVKVFSVKIKDRDGDELFLTNPSHEEREVKHSLMMMFRCDVLEIKEVWSFKLEEQSENEKMLMERGYFASEEAIEKEEDLKF